MRGRCSVGPNAMALLDPGVDPCLLVEAARCRTGPPFSIEVLRGEWRSRGAPVGPADRLVWEGPPAVILSALTGIGDDDAAFHPGLPVVVPALRMEGLGVWRHGERGEAPAAGPEDRLSIRPPAPRE